MASKGTPATALLARRKVSFTLHEYHVEPGSGSYGAGAAAALGVEPGRVFKTLVAEVDGRLTVGVVPVTGSLSLKALAAAAGGKRATMAEPAQAERATGYVTGGISPFGQRKKVRVFIERAALEADSARSADTVIVNGGRRGLQIELAPADLMRLLAATAADLS